MKPCHTIHCMYCEEQSHACIARSNLSTCFSVSLQIYYSFYGFENPIHYKSEEQQHLLLHLRHPIFLAPVAILWAVPVMTYDRLLVAAMVPLYLGWGSLVDHLDVQYVKEQFHMKKAQLLTNGKVHVD